MTQVFFFSIFTCALKKLRFLTANERMYDKTVIVAVCFSQELLKEKKIIYVCANKVFSYHYYLYSCVSFFILL